MRMNNTSNTSPIVDLATYRSKEAFQDEIDQFEASGQILTRQTAAPLPLFYPGLQVVIMTSVSALPDCGTEGIRVDVDL